MATKTVEASYQRLKTALSTVRPDKSAGSTAIGKLFDELPQTVNNWQTRGVPIEQAVDAQRRWGINAVWLLHGEGEMILNSPSQVERFTEEILEEACIVLADVKKMRPDDWRFTRLTWPSVKTAAKAVLENRGDEEKIVRQLLDEIGK